MPTVSAAVADLQVRVGAVIVTGQAVVVAVFLDDQLQRSILRPTKSEESRKEVLGRLRHAVLSRRADDNLGPVVRVQVAVLVVVEHTGIKQPDSCQPRVFHGQGGS